MSPSAIKKWRTLENKISFRGKIFRYREVERESTTQEMRGSFDVLDFLEWVNIIAITKDSKVLLVRQYRQGIDAVTTEIPGGAVDIGEEPFAAAQRELKEETGFESNNWQSLGAIEPNPAFQSNRCHVYLAKECVKVAEPQLDPLEELEVDSIALDEVKSMVKEGRIRHALVVAAFYMAGDELS